MQNGGKVIDFYNLQLDDEETWKLLESGDTKGVWQLETSLGKHYSKEIKPKSIDEISDLISAMRPGTLKSKQDGKSLTDLYCDRKFGRAEVKYIHPALEPILKETQGVILYQEEILRIAADLAGYNLNEADSLRKAIGLKIPEIMNENESRFLEGCKRVGILNEEEAKTVFGWIREAQKYSFNKSHGVGYGVLTFLTAYCKSHYPLEFFTAYLAFAKEKQDPKKELRELIKNVREHKITLKIPSLSYLKEHPNFEFHIHNNDIIFGVSSIKDIGVKHLEKLVDSIRNVEIKWPKVISLKTHKNIIVNLISVGVFDEFKLPRQKLLYEYSILNQLTDRERNFIFNNNLQLKEGLEGLITSKIPNVNRKEIIRDLIKGLIDPPYDLVDNPKWIAEIETELIGCPLTYSMLDSCQESRRNTYCADFIAGKKGNMIIDVEINNIKEHVIKKGKNKGQVMGVLSVEDESGNLDCLAFDEVWSKNRNIFFPGNTVTLFGYRSKKDTFIIQNSKQL